MDSADNTPTSSALNEPGRKPGGILHSLHVDLTKLNRQHRTRRRLIIGALTNRGFHAIFLYRLSHLLWKSKIPLLPLILTRISQTLFAVDIAYEAELGPGIVIVHGIGLVVGNSTKIAGDCCLYHGVTLGNRGSEWVGSSEQDGQPVLEESIMIGAGAKIIGPVRIGRNSVIGANAVVVRDVPASSIVAGIPGRVVGQRPEMDDNLRPIGGHRPRPAKKIDNATTHG